MQPFALADLRDFLTLSEAWLAQATHIKQASWRTVKQVAMIAIPGRASNAAMCSAAAESPANAELDIRIANHWSIPNFSMPIALSAAAVAPAVDRPPADMST